MTLEELKKTETAPEVVAKPETIAVDIDGISVQVDLETGKKLIEARQKSKKEVTSLKEQVAKVEAEGKASAQRASLLEAMKASDIDSVRSQVSAEYVDKISAYENKIFKGEVKSLLASNGVLAEALDDACSLVLQGAKVSLDGDIVKINDKDAKEHLAEWIKTKPHLVSVKSQGAVGKTGTKTHVPAKPAADVGANLSKGMANFLKGS